MLSADVKFDVDRTRLQRPRAGRAPGDRRDARRDGRRGRGVPARGDRQARRARRREVDLRYAGQGYELSPRSPRARLADAGELERLRQTFEAEYTRRYGFANAAAELEATTWKVTALRKPPAARAAELADRRPRTSSARTATRQAYFPETGGYVDVPDLRRGTACDAGVSIDGPAIVEELGVDHGPAAGGQRDIGQLRQLGGEPHVKQDVDPITLGVVWGALQSVAVEIGSTIHRTAYSDQAREGQDFSVAVFDAQGRMVCPGPLQPRAPRRHASRGAQRASPHTRPPSSAPGDVVPAQRSRARIGPLPGLLRHPPVLLRGRDHRVRGQHPPSHGRRGRSSGQPGASRASRDYHQEGLFIPPVKVGRGRAGERVADPADRRQLADARRIWSAISRRSCNSLRVGELRVAELAERHGLDTYLASPGGDPRHAARPRCRSSIAAIPDGAYPFEDFMDDCGGDSDPIRCVATVTVDGDELTVDFAGTDPQTESGLNSYFNYTRSYTYMAIKCLTDPFGPMNAGVLRPLTITCPDGHVPQPAPARPAADRGAIICHRIFELVHRRAHPGAARARPGRLLALLQPHLGRLGSEARQAASSPTSCSTAAPARGRPRTASTACRRRSTRRTSPSRRSRPSSR